MWRKIVGAFGVLLGMGVIVAYIGFAAHLVDEHHKEQKVDTLFISINEGSAMRKFTSADYIRKQLQRKGIKIEDRLIDSVDAVGVTECIMSNGFIQDVDVYVTYSGEAHVSITPHKPVMRLLSGGLNSYVTSEGEVFNSPQGAAYYTAVVTGSYKPRFSAKYEGFVSDCYAELLAAEDEKIATLNEELAALNSARRECKHDIAELRNSRGQKFWESDASYNLRMVGVRQGLKINNSKLVVLNGQKREVEKARQRVEKRKKKLQKSCDDFTNLINFVSRVEEDDFWGAEVVQFVADTTRQGDITLRLVPRSGDFVIEFGTLADSEEKLSKLQEFYNKGLSRLGWERFKTIDVRFKKQVVCTK